MMFTHEQIRPRVYRIKDILGVAMYLVIGKEKCCLLDTGYGIKGLKDYIQSICHLPIIVLLSHGHIDHALGAYEFDDVYMNELDIQTYFVHSQEDYRRRFIKQLAVDLDWNQCQPKREKAFLKLNDLQEFDLGGITIQAIHTPGHTVGMTMFLIKEERMILFGDGCGPGTILLEDFSTDIKTYYQSLMKIKSRENEYDIILRNHGTCVSNKDLLDNVIEVCQKILNHQDDHILLPKQMRDRFFLSTTYCAYSAMKVKTNEHGIQREDGKEGNICYREDKI